MIGLRIHRCEWAGTHIKIQPTLLIYRGRVFVRIRENSFIRPLLPLHPCSSFQIQKPCLLLWINKASRAPDDRAIRSFLHKKNPSSLIDTIHFPPVPYLAMTETSVLDVSPLPLRILNPYLRCQPD